MKKLIPETEGLDRGMDTNMITKSNFFRVDELNSIFLLLLVSLVTVLFAFIDRLW